MTARDFFYAPSGALRAPWRILAFVVLVVALGIVIGAFAFQILRPTSQLARQFTSFIVALVALVMAHAVMLVAVDRQPWSTVGLARFQASPRAIAEGLLLGALGIGIPCALLVGAHWLRATPEPVGIGWIAYAGASALFFLPQAMTEEMLSRGYIFTAIREGAGWRWALTITSIAFGLLHLGNPGVSARPIVLVILAGFFLGGIRLITDSLYAAWMAHFAWNWMMAGVVHTAVSGVAIAPPSYMMVDAGPDWLTGGAWGPEGGVPAGIGMIVLFGALLAMRKRAGARARAEITPTPVDANG